jgi:hypothetical protein
LLEANSRLEASQSVVRLVGPGLAGMLVQLVTAPIAIVLDILSYVLSALLLGRIRVREPEPSRPGPRQPLLREIAQGLQFVARHPILRPMVTTVASVNLFGAMVAPEVILFATRELLITPALLGLIFGAAGVGAILGPPTRRRLRGVSGWDDC